MSRFGTRGLAHLMLALLVGPVLAHPPLGPGSQESAPSPVDPLALLGDLRRLAELDLPGELIPAGRRAVAADGLLRGSGEARSIVARALFAADLEDEAFGLLADDAVPASERPWLELTRARLLLLGDDLAGAAALLRSAAGPEPVRHPQRAEPWILLARVEARAKAPGSAKRAAVLARGFLDRAPLDPEAPTAWHLLAQEALGRRDGEAASGYLEQARGAETWHALLRARRLQVHRDPDAPLPRLGLGLVWMQVRRYERARSIFEDLVVRHPDFARGWYHLGEALRLTESLAEAYGAYGRALELDSSQHGARFNRAVLDVLRGETAEAREAFEFLALREDVVEDPNFVGLFLQLARLDLADGQGERAAERYARYRELGGTEALEPR